MSSPALHSTLTLTLLFLLTWTPQVSAHARLMEPPSRASMWRLGYDNPPDFNDHQGFCGGFKHQYGRAGGQCGICGDPADAWPRQHEAPGGRFANGIITRQYRPGQDIVVKIDVTANHKGFFMFKLCSNNNTVQDPVQSCFDETVLRVVPSGEDRYYLTTFNTGVFTLKLRLPHHVWCSQCILQWTYTVIVYENVALTELQSRLEIIGEVAMTKVSRELHWAVALRRLSGESLAWNLNNHQHNLLHFQGLL